MKPEMALQLPHVNNGIIFAHGVVFSEIGWMLEGTEKTRQGKDGRGGEKVRAVLYLLVFLGCTATIIILQ